MLVVSNPQDVLVVSNPQDVLVVSNPQDVCPASAAVELKGKDEGGSISTTHLEGW